jgi:jasmonate O-methyltransferase
MVVVDLGCSSGPNALVIVSEVMSKVRAIAREESAAPPHCRACVGVQFFLNDLPSNDFNLVFRSLEQLQELSTEEEAAGVVATPYYVAGLPGSFYKRLLPCGSVHLFHSSYCLMWLSKVRMVPRAARTMFYLAISLDCMSCLALVCVFNYTVQGRRSQHIRTTSSFTVHDTRWWDTL